MLSYRDTQSGFSYLLFFTLPLERWKRSRLCNLEDAFFTRLHVHVNLLKLLANTYVEFGRHVKAPSCGVGNRNAISVLSQGTHYNLEHCRKGVYSYALYTGVSHLISPFFEPLFVLTGVQGWVALTLNPLDQRVKSCPRGKDEIAVQKGVAWGL